MSQPTDLATIEKQAKHIMDSFMKELGEVKQEDSFGLEREAQTREPRVEECSEQFRKAFLANAPNTRDNLLIMERKQW